jgi:PTS system nitrogen regulatory IIA component
MRIVEFLHQDAVIADLQGTTGAAVLEELCRPVAARCGVEAPRLVQILLDREKLGSTGIGEGVAIPHGKVPGLTGMVAAFGRSRAGVDYRAIDGRPARLFLALFAPENSAGAHLKALARVSRLFRVPAFRESILAASDAESILRQIATEDAKD